MTEHPNPTSVVERLEAEASATMYSRPHADHAADLRFLLTRLQELEGERDEARKQVTYWRDYAETTMEAEHGAFVSEARKDAQAAEARIAEYREAAAAVLGADREALADHRPKWGLADCVDNAGKPYQSQYLADALQRLRSLLSDGGRG